MKDAKGHGSNTRDGRRSADDAANRLRGQIKYPPKGGFRYPGDPPRQMTAPIVSNAEAAQSLMSTLKSTQAPVHDSMVNAAGGHGQDWGTNAQGHAWGSPEALADFKAKYGGPRDHAAEQRGFNSGKREIKQLRKRGR